MLEITLTDEQLYLKICFLVFACPNKLKHSFINKVQKYIKSMIKLNPFVTRLILGWGISSDHQKNSQVKIWAATATYLRSKGYIRSKFQSGKFGNLIADSESLQKSVKRKCLSFFDIPTRTWCNLTSKVVFGLNLLFCLKFCVF